MKILCAWMVLGVCCVANAGEYQSVLVNKAEAVEAVAVSKNTDCDNCSKCVTNSCDDCCKVQVYNEKVEDRKTCRKTLFGKVIKREVKRTTLTPVR
jgi:hypothetical protein